MRLLPTYIVIHTVSTMIPNFKLRSVLEVARVPNFKLRSVLEVARVPNFKKFEFGTSKPPGAGFYAIITQYETNIPTKKTPPLQSSRLFL